MPITSSASGVKAGTVAFFAANSTPPGWLKANGATISRAAYAALFAAIGTTYGAGDGATTFKLPDCRGEFLRGLDDGRGIDAGREVGSAQNDAMQGHWHENYYQVGVATQGSAGALLGIGATNNTKNNSSNAIRQPNSDGTNGTPRTAAETRPRNVAMLACIKY